MSQLWSEINKVVNVIDPASQSATSGTTVNTDVVNMENYNKCTFLIHMGAVADNEMAVTAYAVGSNITSGSAIDFRYRTQENAVPPATASDLQSELTTGSTFLTTTGDEGAMYIVEIDAPTVAAESAGYNHTYLKFVTAAGHGTARIYGVLAILSEPRYPQAILQTAID